METPVFFAGEISTSVNQLLRPITIYRQTRIAISFGKSVGIVDLWLEVETVEL